MARRGEDTLLFGPLKPVGLELDGELPYAVIQCRKEQATGSLYNLVGFQTNLTFKAQKALLQTIPALRHVEIVRYGVMHRNTYLNSPKILNLIFSDKAI
jgi:methylenetetrahydrofolate--tRNA-(uracil-5-)-methyltransferase